MAVSKTMVILLVVAMVGVGFLATQAFDITGFSTESTINSKKGYSFTAIIKGGSENGITFATSWLTDAKSESILMVAQVKRTDWITVADPHAVRFNVYLEGKLIDTVPSGDWISVQKTGILEGGKWYDVATATYEFRGEVVGRMEVKTEWKISDVLGNFQGELGKDGAYLKSGKGSIEVYEGTDGVTPAFEVGSTVKLVVNTGYSGGRGWTIDGFAPSDRTDITIKNPVLTLGDDVRNKIVEVKVGADWFRAKSTNIYEYRLTNGLFEEGFCQAFIVDDLARCPEIVNIAATNNGDSFTYTVTVNKTYAELSHVAIWAWYGYGGTTMPAVTDTESWIIYNGQFPITGNVAIVTITPKGGLEGTILTKIVCYDVDGRASDQIVKQFIVAADGSTDKGGGALSTPFIWSNLTILVCAAGIGITALAAAWLFVAGKMETALIVAGIGGAITAILTYVIGITPDLAFAAGYIAPMWVSIPGLRKKISEYVRRRR